MTRTHTGETDRNTVDEVRASAKAGDPGAIVEMGRFFRAGVASPEDFADAETRALAFYRPGDFDSLRVLLALRREACAIPPPPPCLDALNAELNRRQAIGREPHPPELDEAGLAALRERADSGDIEASYLLGRALILRDPSDKPEALAALLRAAEAGHVAAGFQAGTLLYHGWGVPRDVPRALTLLETSARTGNADAARFLALSYDGVGGNVPQDPEMAMQWWNEAARLGDRHACHVVGRNLYEEGPTPEERSRGLELIERAAERGFPPACGFLGRLKAEECFPYEDLVEELAFPLLRLGAVRGDSEAARFLARKLHGLGGRERAEEALYWLHETSRRDGAAARLLGQLCGQGLEGERGDATATAWLALAAEEWGVGEPDADALTTLARCFLDGRGVPHDPAVAIQLTERAASLGFGPGARLRGEIAEDGLGVPRDAAQATAWYRRGAELGDGSSMSRFGTRLFDGHAVEPDARQAAAWLEKAVAEGAVEACHLLALMLFRGEGTDPDPVRAQRLLQEAARFERLPALFTSLEEEALRFRPAATRPRNLRDRTEELAADPGSLPATAALDAGILIWNGDVGLLLNDPLATELFRVAAGKGSALAAACLSYALQLAGDEEGEIEWLEKAADAGLAGAQRQLAYRLVDTGRAGRTDPRPLGLLEKAAGQGDPVAGDQLASLSRSPTART
ncbi:MAG: sel1 repeat family protein [Holophagales bacterium]|nr:sel1 repeat family protein [Holophagales bacterium]